jgi:pimeloyl-ACP methyl ester carboxylesterase
MLYRSSDTHRNASWAAAVVFIPNTHRRCSTATPEECSHGIVSYQVPYDSASFDASPSFLLQFGDPYQEIADFLNRGWFVVATDYEGPSASYCDGPQAGYATLDGARAILKVAGVYGLRVDRAKHAVVGYSGGSFAAAFAAELAADYAPDLQLAGVLVGGPSPNLTTGGLLMNKKDTAGLVVASLVGITAQHPAAREFLLSRLKPAGPYNITGFMNATNLSGLNSLYAYARHNIFDYFINGAADFFHPVLQDLLTKQGHLGFHGIPNMPVFIYKAMNDEMSPIKETDDLVAKYCAGGGNILYHRNTLGGHNQELWSSRPRVMRYLHAVLDGDDILEIPETGCMKANFSIPLNMTEIIGPSYQPRVSILDP